MLVDFLIQWLLQKKGKIISPVLLFQLLLYRQCSVYPSELEIKDTTITAKSASYLDLHLSVDTIGRLYTKLNDKRDHFNFQIMNFPFLSSYIPTSPAYGVCILQLIPYSRACAPYSDFLEIAKALSLKLLNQGYIQPRLK